MLFLLHNDQIIVYLIFMVLTETVLQALRDMINEKYVLIFALAYAMLSYIVLYILRKVIYSRKKILEIFTKTPSKVQYALIINIIVYLSIFLMNITLGEKVGYSINMLMFNSFLFLICLIATTWILLNVMKGIEVEEKQKDMLH